MSLSEIRKKIDEIDSSLVSLLCDRMECSLKVAEIKRAEGLPVYHPVREQQIIDNVREKGGEYGTYIAEIYNLLMACSRELQHEALSDTDEFKRFISSCEKKLTLWGNVMCYGEEDSYSHIALTTAFKQYDFSVSFGKSFEDIFKAVNNEEVSFGFVPVENSSAGSVKEVYDLILKYKLYIAGSVSMPIIHSLLAVKGAKLSDIKIAYSHDQALLQCRDFLDAHNISGETFSNTAAAVRHVSDLNDPHIAAIGSTASAKKHGLETICSSIQSFDDNKTRFIVLSKRPIIEKSSDIISLVFSLSHTPGSLQKILTRFSLYGLNLTKLESRAGKNGNFETQFYLDFNGNVENEKTLSLLSALSGELADFSFLGNYHEIALGGTL